jgi:hypothetical protein
MPVVVTTGVPIRFTSTLSGLTASGRKSKLASIVVVGTSSSSLQAPLSSPLSWRSSPM